MLKNSILLAILLFGTTYSAVVQDKPLDLASNSKLGFVNAKLPALINLPLPQTQPLPNQIQIEAPQTLAAIQAAKPSNLLQTQPQIEAPQTLAAIQATKPLTSTLVKPCQAITAPTEPTVQQPNWSYVVGISGSCAAKVIKNQRSDLSVVIMKPGAPWTKDFNFNRVRIAVDKFGIVTKTPVIG